jgi:hypothetical protein
MKRLAVIIPYDEKYIDDFTDHFKVMVPEGDIYYKLIFMKQKSNRPLNKGKLFNIGYMLHKDKFDYFCFHDSDLIPISEECDYSYPDKPISLVSMRNKIEFGEQKNIKDFEDFSLPYDEYFGGAILFSTKDFLKVNGYSNEYWGFGFEDYDLLFRCIKQGLPVKEELGMTNIKYCGRFNGINSFGEIIPMNNKLKNLTNRSFTMTAWVCPDGEPPYSDDVDNNKCEYFIFGRPGYHMGLSYTHGNFLKAVLWVKSKSVNREAIVVKVKVDNVKPDRWFHVGMVVNDRNQVLTLYVNGKKVGEQYYEGELVNYLNKPYYIGVGNPSVNYWQNFYKGQITEVGLWDKDLSESEFNLIYEKGIIDKQGQYVTTNLPIGVWDLRGGYGNMTFDITGNNNHGKVNNVVFENKYVKKGVKRYLPNRRNGAYGYIALEKDYLKSEGLINTNYNESLINRKTFNLKVLNKMKDNLKDGLSSTKFRIVNRKDYQGKHEIIEVVI